FSPYSLRPHQNLQSFPTRRSSDLKIDGLSTKDMQLPDAVKRMRGKPGTKVTITVVREGWTESKDFDITREQIRVQSVRSADLGGDRKSTRLNSSHQIISYAVFCLK